MPDKFEDRKNVFKPWLYRVMAVACILLAVFPEWLPVAAPWLIRTVGIIAALMTLIASWMAGTSTYNKQSGGKIRTVNTKKFIREETEVEAIVAAFKQHDFRYLAELPSGNNQPVQLHVDEDPVGREFYCLLTTICATMTRTDICLILFLFLTGFQSAYSQRNIPSTASLPSIFY